MGRFNWKPGFAAIIAAALVACGGSDDNSPPFGGGALSEVDRVVVVGDSLSDSGTFEAVAGMARTFTVQGTSSEPYVVWVERIAQAYGLAPLCPTYRAVGAAQFQPGLPDCTNYAVGGGRINNTLQPGGAEAPLSILRQLADAGAQGWQAGDLVVIDGGGNDMADLVTAYLASALDEGAAYQDLLLTLLSQEMLQDLLPRENGPEQAAVLYLQALADVLAGTVDAQVLERGATRVAIANMPTVTHTPKFQMVLAGIELAFGKEQRDLAEAMFHGWIGAFNAQLASDFEGDARVAIVDIAARFDAFMQDPAGQGLTNVTIPVCGADGFPQVPQRAFVDCTAEALSSTPPPAGAPAGSNWWTHFLFADSFHPTPYGHQLMGEAALETLQDASWF